MDRPVGTWPTPVPDDARSASSEDQEATHAELLERLEAELPPSLQILRPIGRGSMADVFLAREPHLKRLVAVKVLSPHLYGDREARKRFEREAQAAARLNHPHICTVFSVGSLEDGTPYLVSPFVKGTTLGHHLKAEGRLGTAEVRQVIREVASALAAAHQLGIIHRDVRPENILREDDTGRHFLCDFGIAGVLETGDRAEPRITRTGEVLGHPAYMSPEQADGGPVTDRADIYSLGVMAHQLLTGRPPPMARDRGRLAPGVPTPPDLAPLEQYIGDTDPDLLDLVGRCLASRPEHRPAAADIARKCEKRAEEMARANGFLSLLLEKRFLHIMGGYIAGGWLVLEATDQLESRLLLPEPAYSLALTTVLFGFIATCILAWYHGKEGRQAMTGLEKTLLTLVTAGWAAVCGLVIL